MKILYDNNMPFAKACFETLGECHEFDAKSLTPAQIAGIDALMCRSTLKVNSTLLAHAESLKMVATATAGINHLDLDYLNRVQIPWTSAAGCNAVAVAEYVLSALFASFDEYEDPLAQLQSKQVGIVGAGNVGSALSEKCRALNIPFLLNDPPLEKNGDSRTFVGLDRILKCDIICLHVPFISNGEFPTENLLDFGELSQLSENQIVVNACRGGVVCESAFLDLCKGRNMPAFIVDAWESEPGINGEFLKEARLGTPHIAGHTLEGKARGTFMVYEALANLFDKEVTVNLESALPEINPIKLDSKQIEDSRIVSEMIFSIYDIRTDNRHFRRLMAQSDDAQDTFREFRAEYAIRREFSAQTLEVPKSKIEHKNVKMLAQLGFTIAAF
jgi:erythronate-4-phosphate dehydrogenase